MFYLLWQVGKLKCPGKQLSHLSPPIWLLQVHLPASSHELSTAPSSEHLQSEIHGAWRFLSTEVSRFSTLPKQLGCWKNPGLQSLHWSPSKLSLHKQIPLALQLDSTEPSGSHWQAEIVHNKYLHIMYNCTTLTNRFEIAYYCKMADLDRIDFGSP